MHRSNAVAVTGMGIVCSIGQGRNKVMDAIRQSASGLVRMQFAGLGKWAAKTGGEVRAFIEDNPKEFTDRTEQLAYAAFREALLDSHLDFSSLDPYRCGLSFGSCNGNMLTLENIYDHWDEPQDVCFGDVAKNHFGAIDRLALELDIRGPKAIFVTACAGSNHAIGYGKDLIDTGQADVVIVGGSDSFSKTTWAGFNSLQAICGERCAPFSKEMGIALGEGAAFMILEKEESARKRGARIHAFILGYGFAGDAYHATAPDVTGKGAMRSMHEAISSSGIDPQQIGFISAHGTGTEANDKVESLAIEKTFQHPHHLSITSTKGIHGHTLGASGIIQSVICIDSMNQDLVPSIPHFSQEREGCTLSYVKNTVLAKKSQAFISNSFAFGGNNVSVVVGKEAAAGNILYDETKKVVITGMDIVTPLSRGYDDFVCRMKENRFYRTENNVLTFDRYELGFPQYRKFRKCPRITQFAIESVVRVLENAAQKTDNKNKENIGLIWAAAKGPLKVFEQFYRQARRDGFEFASARLFPHTVYNAVAGQVSIALGLKGCNTTVAGQFSPFLGMQYASQLIKQSRQDVCLVGGSDEISDFDKRIMSGKNEGKAYFLSEGAAVVLLQSEESARKNHARIYGEIDGFCCHSGREDNRKDVYNRCLESSILKAGLKKNDVDLHIFTSFTHPDPGIREFGMPATSQKITGTLESATAIANTLLGVTAVSQGFVPDYFLEGRLRKKEYENVLISGAANNNTYYSFILKRYDGNGMK